MLHSAMAVLVIGAGVVEAVQHRQPRFNCYVSIENIAPVALYEKPAYASKVVVRIAPNDGMLSTINRVKHRGEWMYVQWAPGLESKEKPRKGWIHHPDVKFGECED